MKITNYLILFSILAFTIISCSKKSDPAPIVIQPALGLSYEGGIIFYLDNTSNHGLIAATADAPFSTEWGCEGTLCGAAGSSTGTGAQNTNAIINLCDSTGIAAQLCKSSASGGYNDWFLPSKDELNLIYTNLYSKSLGGFAASFYWSSTESDANNGWYQFLGNGFQDKYGKSYQFHVRPVRAF